MLILYEGLLIAVPERVNLSSGYHSAPYYRTLEDLEYTVHAQKLSLRQ